MSTNVQSVNIGSGRLRPGSKDSNVDIKPVASKSFSQKKYNVVSQDASAWSGRLRRGSQIGLGVTRSNKPFRGNEATKDPSISNALFYLELSNLDYKSCFSFQTIPTQKCNSNQKVVSLSCTNRRCPKGYGNPSKEHPSKER